MIVSFVIAVAAARRVKTVVAFLHSTVDFDQDLDSKVLSKKASIR